MHVTMTSTERSAMIEIWKRKRGQHAFSSAALARLSATVVPTVEIACCYTATAGICPTVWLWFSQLHF